jgi:hypothetical protein
MRWLVKVVETAEGRSAEWSEPHSELPALYRFKTEITYGVK